MSIHDVIKMNLVVWKVGSNVIETLEIVKKPAFGSDDEIRVQIINICFATTRMRPLP